MKVFNVVAGTGAAISVMLLGSGNALAFQTLDFEDLENGQIVDDEYVSQGVTVSTFNANRDFNFGVVFDTRLDGTSDADLEAPFHDFVESDFSSSSDADRRSFAGDVRDGNNGVINPGNILVVQENNDGCGDGICDDPDDEANRPNGWFNFSFDTPVFLSSIDFFDVESEENNPSNQITLTTTTGAEVFFTPNTGGNFNYSGTAYNGPGAYNSWDRTFFNVAEVTMIRINMGGSGGIDNIRFSKDVPAPAPLALLALGLLLARRKGSS
ncbi:MAG: MYXO-CTERM sorting domain-containing protein [Congregibacter sp.]